MEKELAEKLSRIFKAEYEKINLGFYEAEAWKKYLRGYSEIHFLSGISDMVEFINHGEIIGKNPVAVRNPASLMEILVLPREFADKVLALGLPRDVSSTVEEFKSRPVPRLGRKSKK